MVELMTSAEVTERLSLDEDPLDLAIEKWQRLLQTLIENGRIQPLSLIGSSTCALCIVTPLPDDEDKDDCAGCLYYEHWGEGCDTEGGTFRLAIDRYFELLDGKTELPSVQDAFRGMIDALKEVKRNQ